MAIVINGSGTITGISVGGLPDSIVDAGTLATNSVDSAELIDGSIDTAHIAADQITGAILPAGSVLQVVQAVQTTTTTISTTGSWQVVGLEAAITPSSSSSKILITVTGSQYTDVNDQTAGATIFRDSTRLGDTTTGFMPTYISWGAGGSQDLQVACNVTYLDSPSTTSATTYSVKAYTDKSTYKWNGIRTCHAVIVLMEIAG
jgi:hypothetical protein